MTTESAPEEMAALLERWSRGDRAALDELTPLVYEHLHAMAQRAFRCEQQAVTLQATAVVNEAYLQLASASVEWQDSGHFFALASRMMRRILVNHSQSRRAAKRGGDRVMLTYDDAQVGAEPASDDVLDLDEALRALDKIDSRKVEILELHYFAGLSYDDTAAALDISPATVKRDLRFGKAWIRRYLAER